MKKDVEYINIRDAKQLINCEEKNREKGRDPLMQLERDEEKQVGLKKKLIIGHAQKQLELINKKQEEKSTKTLRYSYS